MSEYVVDFGDKSTAFVGLAMAEAESHGATLKEGVVRCGNCREYRASDATCHSWQWHNWDAPIEVEPDGFCYWGERRGE